MQNKHEVTNTLNHLQSDTVLAMDQQLRTDLPREEFKVERHQKVAQAAIDVAQVRHVGQPVNLFVDVGSSENRLEHCDGASTCIKPTHAVWSVQHHRYVTLQEMFGLQAHWIADHPHPDVMRKLWADPVLAQESIGNAFSLTVAQAVLLAAISHSQGLRERVGSRASPSAASTKEALDGADDGQEGPCTYTYMVSGCSVPHPTPNVTPPPPCGMWSLVGVASLTSRRGSIGCLPVCPFFCMCRSISPSVAPSVACLFARLFACTNRSLTPRNINICTHS